MRLALRLTAYIASSLSWVLLSPCRLAEVIMFGIMKPKSNPTIARGTEPSERNTANSYFLAYNNVLSIAVPVILGYMAIFLGYGYSFSILSIPVLLVTILLFRKYGRNPRIFYQPEKRSA